MNIMKITIKLFSLGTSPTMDKAHNTCGGSIRLSSAKMKNEVVFMQNKSVTVKIFDSNFTPFIDDMVIYLPFSNECW